MKPFLSDDFLLDSDLATELYHEVAVKQPIIDYHNHLSPELLAQNHQFANLSEAWLAGDHYKWRAMRANGIDERYITGGASDEEKFQKWAETVPYTLRNPLYHWSHLELRRYFGIDLLLNGDTAKEVYEEANKQLQQPSHSVRALLEQMNVELICTTDDPADSLEHHFALAGSWSDVKVLPTFRADALVQSANAQAFSSYVEKLAKAAKMEVRQLNELKAAVRSRHDHFAAHGCKLSDHGLGQLPTNFAVEAEAAQLFKTLLGGQSLKPDEQERWAGYILLFLAELDNEKGWTQQFHLGAIRNNNPKRLAELGPDTGYDSIGDFQQAEGLNRFFAELENRKALTRTILYNLNPADNEVFATTIGNFQDGQVAGKMQFGSGWWFLDQKQGMEQQMNALSNMGLLRRFVGMLTDSRSFLSYPRHEYFRRILCNLLATDVVNGELPDDRDLLRSVVAEICYSNAKSFFKF